MSPLKQKIIIWTYQKPNGMGFQPWIFVGVAAMAFARLTRDRPQKTSVGCSRTMVVIWVGYVISLEGILFPQLRLIFLLHMLEVVLSKLLFKCLKWYYSINTTLFQISTANKMRASTERTYGKRDLRNDNKQSNFHADTISTYSNLMTFFFLFFFLTARWGMILLMEEIRPTSWYGEKLPFATGFMDPRWFSRRIFWPSTVSPGDLSWYLGFQPLKLHQEVLELRRARGGTNFL